MRTQPVAAKTKSFTLPAGIVGAASLALPAVKGTWGMKYGRHAYTFMNFHTLRGVAIMIRHLDIIRPGLRKFLDAAGDCGKPITLRRCLASDYHYGFHLLEQLMLMTVPHTITPIGNARFLVNLWAWRGYLLADAGTGAVSYHLLDARDHDDAVLGTQQWFDRESGDLLAMRYSLRDSLARINDPDRPVRFELFRHRHGEPGTEPLWSGELADFMHDLQVNQTRQYAVACELGMVKDKTEDMLPSKVLVLDLQNNRHWHLDRFMVAAHACFDPVHPNVVYFSNHNFEFRHSSLVKLLKKGSYAVHFHGPASIFRYELTPDGPHETGVFTREDFFRLTNMHAFVHRDRTLIAAMGFPDVVFLIDADTMRFIRTIQVRDPVTINHLYSRQPALIGTICPSPDGEKLFVRTTRSFQIVDVASGEPAYIRDDFFSHICFNHMIATTDTAW